MNRRLRQITGYLCQNGGPTSAIAASLLLAIATGGCASGRPAGLLIQHELLRPRLTPPADDDMRLKVVTYNIWGLPSWMTGARPGRYGKIAMELERLDPDFILLQEAWTATARSAAPCSKKWAIARPAGQHTFFQQSGLMTLSRFPIIGGQFYPFSRAAFPDKFVNKGMLKVTVQLPGGRVLNVWNVHLQDGGSTAVKHCQIQELVAQVRATEDGQMADLIGGDFNCTPDSELFRELAGALGPTVQQLSGTQPFATWDGLSSKPGSAETLDYIFVRQAKDVQFVRSTPRVAFTAPNLQQRLSDHLGIEAVVTFGTTAIVAEHGPFVLSSGRMAVTGIERESTADGN